MALKIETVGIDEVRPYENNTKLHTPEQIGQIVKSIEEFGNNDPIAVAADGTIIEGHGRWMALKQMGAETVEVIRLGHLTDEQRRAYTIVHNQLTMNTGFDMELLERELEAIDGIDMGDYGMDLGDLGLPDAEKEVEEVEAPEPGDDEPRTKLGDVYRLGDHVLMCGDSTKAADVERLMGGAKADMALTDPPYNVDYQGRTEKALKIDNDNMGGEAFHAFLLAAFQNMERALHPGGAFYVWYASRESVNFETSVAEAGLDVKQQLIWNKSVMVLGRQDYQWKHEPCLYGWKPGAPHWFTDSRSLTTVIEDYALADFGKMRKDELVALLQKVYGGGLQTTVIDEDKPSRSELHPTMKPVKLMARLVRNSSKPGETVLDLFGGSGSTLMACEQLGRSCRMMEYDPRYCDVIVERWEAFTGQKAVKE